MDDKAHLIGEVIGATLGWAGLHDVYAEVENEGGKLAASWVNSRWQGVRASATSIWLA